jgi:hypothetical protein
LTRYKVITCQTQCGGDFHTHSIESIQHASAKAPTVAVEWPGDAGAPPVACRRLALHGHSCIPSASTGNGRKSGKHSLVNTPLESSCSKQSQLVKLARGSHDLRIAYMDMKCKKIELRDGQARDERRIAAEEWTLILQNQIREKELQIKERQLQIKEKELASREQMMQLEIELM